VLGVAGPNCRHWLAEISFWISASLGGFFCKTGLAASVDQSSLRIEKVLAGSPAEIAGIKAGDFIVAVKRPAA
jgi:C-terminal processing protease CtpA/Prc